MNLIMSLSDQNVLTVFHDNKILFYFFFGNRVSLCNPGRPETHSVDPGSSLTQEKGNTQHVMIMYQPEFAFNSHQQFKVKKNTIKFKLYQTLRGFLSNL